MVQIFWLDDQGNRQSYGEVAAHSRKEQHTYGGHVWLVADARGEIIAVFEATDDPDVAVIRAIGRRPARSKPRMTTMIVPAAQSAFTGWEVDGVRQREQCVCASDRWWRRDSIKSGRCE